MTNQSYFWDCTSPPCAQSVNQDFVPIRRASEGETRIACTQSVNQDLTWIRDTSRVGTIAPYSAALSELPPPMDMNQSEAFLGEGIRHHSTSWEGACRSDKVMSPVGTIYTPLKNIHTHTTWDSWGADIEMLVFCGIWDIPIALLSEWVVWGCIWWEGISATSLGCLLMEVCFCGYFLMYFGNSIV